MTTVKINNEMNLTYPDGFREMSEEELTRYFGSPENRWGVYDAEKHIILSVGWKKAGLSDVDMALFEIESRMRRSLVNYQRIGEFNIKIAEKKAQGVRFEYRVNDSARVHVGDLFAVKCNKKFYTVSYITRKFNAAETRPAFEEVLKSISIG